MIPTPATLGEVPLHAAARDPRGVAIWFRGERITFQSFADRVDRLAATLRQRGVRRGDRVAIYAENTPDYLAAYFAVPAVGATLVPLNTFLAPAELTGILADARPAFVLVGAGLRGRLRLPENMEGIGAIESLEELVAAPARHAPDRGEPERIAADSPAVILYTSGTTGRPKGVILSHRALLANARACVEAVGVTPRDRILLALPMFHSFTQMVGMLTPLLAGLGIVLCERLDRAEVRRALRRHRPTIMPAVPAVFAAMAHTKLGAIARWLNPVRLYISGGAPLSAETLASFERNFRRPLCEGYGLSEAGPVVSLNPPGGPRKAGSVGRPLPGVSVRITDSAGEAVPPGDTGELLVRSPALMDGYAGLPGETASALSDGWLHTGDMARLDEDQFLFVMGRSKEMLIHRGMNVYPREIECVLESLPEVKEAAVIGVPHPSRGEVPLAFVVAREGTRPTQETLKRACLSQLARYKVPRRFELVESLPRNAAGKVLKKDLAALLVDQSSGRAVPG